jgi:hypothetical protein
VSARTGYGVHDVYRSFRRAVIKSHDSHAAASGLDEKKKRHGHANRPKGKGGRGPEVPPGMHTQQEVNNQF